jgi:hypothetical protein
VLLDNKDLPAHKVNRDQLDRKAQLELVVALVVKDLLVLLAHKDLQDQLVPKESQDQLVQLALKVLPDWVLPEPQDRLEQLVIPAHKAFKVYKVFRATMDLLAQQDQLDQMVAQVQLAQQAWALMELPAQTPKIHLH